MVNVVPRRQWGAARPIPGGRHVPLSSRRFFVLHWPAGAEAADEAQQVRNIERAHFNQGWAVIGYNYLVGNRTGTIFEGCGRDTRGIHSPPRNTDGIGVCVMQGMSNRLSDAAKNSTRALYDQLSAQAGRRLTPTWHGADFATACPGPELIAWVRAGMPASGRPTPTPPTPSPPGRDWFDMATEADLRRIVREEIDQRVIPAIQNNVGGVATVRGSDNVVWALSGAGRWPVHGPNATSGGLNTTDMVNFMRVLGLIGPGTQRAPSIPDGIINQFPRVKGTHGT